MTETQYRLLTIFGWISFAIILISGAYYVSTNDITIYDSGNKTFIPTIYQSVIGSVLDSLQYIQANDMNYSYGSDIKLIRYDFITSTHNFSIIGVVEYINNSPTSFNLITPINATLDGDLVWKPYINGYNILQDYPSWLEEEGK